jgi:hypothetical protein
MLIHSAVITGSVQFNNTDVSGITNVSSFATTSSVDALVVKTGSFATTSSVNELQSKTGSYTSTSSFGTYTASNDLTNATQSTRLSTIESVTGSFTSTSSFGAYSSSINTFTSSATTRLNTIESVTGSFASTSSVNNLQSVTGSYATTGSNQFNGNQSISGSITSNGTITAQTLVVQTVTSSVEFVTGSTRNGSLSTNTHQFTGSVGITGSNAALLNINNGVLYVSASGNVGIGTTSPSQLLEVVGGEIKAGRVDSVNEGGQLSFGRSTDNNTAWYIDLYGNVASPQLRFVDVTGAAVRMTLTGSNVGIGTSTPSYNLDVNGTARVSSAATFSSNVTISGGQTGGYVYASSGYVNETKTVSTNGTSYYLIKSTGTSNGSSGTTFDITGMSTTNGTYADIYAIAQKDATANAINTNVGVSINGQSLNLPTIQANGTGANTVRCTFRVCRMESVWVIIGNPNTSYF